MACLNQQGICTTMGPRISFSNDFADTQQKHGYKEAPVSSDFEFSVSGYKMIPADEVFFKGKLLPLRENSTKATTLKDELLAAADDDDYEDIFRPIGKGSWKERFGFKRAPIMPKKADKETKMPDFFNDIITGAN